MEKYWMVYVQGERGSTFQHTILANAKNEAERLARSSPGKVVTVLESICTALIAAPFPPPVIWTDIKKDDGVPF